MTRPAIAPRLMRQAEAATYCGLSERTFVSLYDGPMVNAGGPTGGQRLRRYDVKDLDAWIEGLKGQSIEDGDEHGGWLQKLGRNKGAA